MKHYVSIIVLLTLVNCTYISIEELIVNCDDFAISIETLVVNADCNLDNGSVTIIVNGGTQPFTYEVDNIVQDDAMFSGLTSGNYRVLVKDTEGCSMEGEFSIFNNDGGVEASSIVSTSGCGTFLGNITVIAANGLSPYQYSLNDDTLQSSNIFNDLTAGSFSVKVIDNIGCEFTFEQQVLTGESYSQNIQPILMQNCSVTGCHNGTQFPDLSILSNVQDNRSNIRIFTQSGFMPLSGSLTQAQIDAIACWIDDGALDN